MYKIHTRVWTLSNHWSLFCVWLFVRIVSCGCKPSCWPKHPSTIPVNKAATYVGFSLAQQKLQQQHPPKLSWNWASTFKLMKSTANNISSVSNNNNIKTINKCNNINIECNSSIESQQQLQQGGQQQWNSKCRKINIIAKNLHFMLNIKTKWQNCYRLLEKIAETNMVTYCTIAVWMYYNEGWRTFSVMIYIIKFWKSYTCAPRRIGYTVYWVSEAIAIECINNSKL